MFEAVKKILPTWLLNKIRPVWHGFLAVLANTLEGNPAQDLFVIGVTGTAGKSTTIQILAHILNSSNKKCGYITTVGYFDGEKEHINTHGLSMPSGPKIQKALRQMLKNDCSFAIVETTSEGLAQNRHLGIAFNAAIFTNLAPAHIRSHGSFEKYRAAKATLFEALAHSTKKNKFSVLNIDDQNAKYFVEIGNEVKKYGVTLKNAQINGVESFNVERDFNIRGQQFKTQLPGEFNLRNAAMAATTAIILNIRPAEVAKALETFTEISGRMQRIPNAKRIKIFLDYAPEPFGMQNSLETVNSLREDGEIIHVFGSTGGHRDISKRFEFGEISAKYADTIIITNDDVYDSDPEEIAKNIYEGIERASEKKVKNILIVLDRREAISKAVKIAQPNDILLFTGKGSEQFLVLPGNKRIAWEEKKVIEEALR